MSFGRERLLGIRFYDDLVDYSLGLEDYKQIAPSGRSRTGKVDYFNMWQGIVPSPQAAGVNTGLPHYYKPGQFAYLPAGLKEDDHVACRGDRPHRFTSPRR